MNNSKLYFFPSYLTNLNKNFFGLYIGFKPSKNVGMDRHFQFLDIIEIVNGMLWFQVFELTFFLCQLVFFHLHFVAKMVITIFFWKI